MSRTGKTLKDVAECMKFVIMSILFALLLFGPQLCLATVLNVPVPYLTIQAGIDAAAPGDTVEVAAGTYAEAPVILKDLTLQGAGEGLTTIDANASAYVGIHVDGNYTVVLRDFSLDGPTGVNGFGIMSAGESQSITIHDVTVFSCQRTAITLNGVIFGDIQNVTCTGTVSGVGFATTDCDNVTINGLTTSGNAWAGAAVYTYGRYFTGGSDNVTFTGALSIAESTPIYAERDEWLAVRPPITNLSIPTSFQYLSGGNATPWLTAYFPNQAGGVAAALAFGATGWTYDRVNLNYYVEGAMKIQAAIDAATAGDEIVVAAGTFNESVNVNKHVKIIGTETVLASLTTINATTGPAFTIAASGVSPANPILFQDLQINLVGQMAFTVPSGDFSYLKLDNVHVDGTDPMSCTESEVGIYVGGLAGLHYLEVVDCSFEHTHYGWYIKKDDFPAGGSSFDNISVDNTDFIGNDIKGVYIEKLSDASFTNCNVSNNAEFYSVACPFTAFGSGIDVNLKGNEAYSNVSIVGCSFTGNGLGLREGMALGLKARGTGVDFSYSAFPATLTDVEVLNCVITGNERGIRFGEPAKSNTSPAGYVFESSVYGNVKTYAPFDGSAYGDIINQTTACCDAGGNWWGSAAPSFATQSYGTVDYSPWMGLAGTNTSPGYDGNFSNLWVDDDSPTCGGSNIVQEGIDMVSGSTLNLSAGTYTGQVVATGFANLNIIGASVGSTTIKAPTTAMPAFFVTGALNNYPVVFCNSSTVHISNLTIDGDGRGLGNYRFQGLAYWNSGGSVTNVDIVRIRENPFNGNQHGVGLYVNHSIVGSYDVNVTNVNISDFQKNGTVFNGVGTNVDCDNVDVVGAGPIGLNAQNGFQYSFGASGTALNSNVSDIAYTGPGFVATSILLYESSDVDLTNTGTNNGQVGVYGIDSDGSVFGGLFVSTTAVTAVEKYGITFYSGGASLSMARHLPQIYSDGEVSDEHGDRSLDANEVFDVDGVSVIGDGSAGGYGVSAYVDGDNLDFSLTNSTVSNWNYGVDLTKVGAGTIAPADITDNTLSNTVNTYDNTAGHTWDSNCYSDFSSNAGYPATYNVAGPGANVDVNPNPNGCSDVNFVVTDSELGCGGTSCDEDTLYITLGTAGLPNLQIDFQLPAGFAVNMVLPGLATPLSNADANLIQAFASDLGGGLIRVDMGFNGPSYSSGDYTKYVACIPLVNVSAGTGTWAITGVASLWQEITGPFHTNELDLGVVTVDVDCTPPVIAFSTTATCAFGSSAQVVNMFSTTLTDANSDLDSAWVTFSGGGSFALFGANQASPYGPTTFPSAGDAATFYSYLVNNACNTLTMHLLDAECNVATIVDILNVGRDETDPSLSVTTSIPLNYCFNNTPATANYGGEWLDDYVDITSLLGANPCMAATGSLVFSHVGAADYTVALDQTNYPINDVEALGLWAWMLTVPGLSVSNGGSWTFDVKAQDCAGNVTAVQQFTICVDTQNPANSLTAFDARPAHLGVWLNWSWAASTQAQEMRIYRSPLSVEYPGYATDMWNTISNYDVTTVPPAGWTLVATQTALAGTVTSATHGANNNRGDFYTHVSGGTYWLDAQVGWVDGDGNATSYRDIYRYVTFVKDAGGNWSTGTPVSMTVNADRSTNYWLGDFSTADAAGLPASRGRVDTDDLGLLSPVYFTAVGGYRNIGPVNLPVENGNIGKGIPNPDLTNLINFSDLVPFSFNYGMVGPVTNPFEFMVQPDPSQARPFSSLDDQPVVSIATESDLILEVGAEFTVAVTLNGNEGNVVKAVEAVLNFDDAMLEFVESSVGDATAEGTLFSKSALIEGEAGHVGFVAASCGGWSTMDGNAILGTVTFRVKSELLTACNLELMSVQMVDNTGEIHETEGDVITVLGAAAIPENYALYQNYPNPFNPTTNIQFDLKEAGYVTILVYNTLGQTVTKVVDRDMVAGRHEVAFDASLLASGLYMYSISVNGFNDLKKMVLIR